MSPRKAPRAQADPVEPEVPAAPPVDPVEPEVPAESPAEGEASAPEAGAPEVEGGASSDTPAESDTPADPPAAPENPDVPEIPAAPDADPEPESGAVEVVVLVEISGLRNGERWPRPGETWTLPRGEAEQYARAGYVRL